MDGGVPSSLWVVVSPRPSPVSACFIFQQADAEHASVRLPFHYLLERVVVFTFGCCCAIIPFGGEINRILSIRLHFPRPSFFATRELTMIFGHRGSSFPIVTQNLSQTFSVRPFFRWWSGRSPLGGGLLSLALLAGGVFLVFE